MNDYGDHNPQGATPSNVTSISRPPHSMTAANMKTEDYRSPDGRNHEHLRNTLKRFATQGTVNIWFHKRTYKSSNRLTALNKYDVTAKSMNFNDAVH